VVWDVTPTTGAYGDTAPQVPIATIAAQAWDNGVPA